MPSILEHLKAKVAELEALEKSRTESPEDHLKVAELLPVAAPEVEDVVVEQPDSKDVG